jgi:hypothetical protein
MCYKAAAKTPALPVPANGVQKTQKSPLRSIGAFKDIAGLGASRKLPWVDQPPVKSFPPT